MGQIIETETMVLDLQHPINGYTKIHRTLHYVDGNCERVVVAFTEEELKLANKAPAMLQMLKRLVNDANIMRLGESGSTVKVMVDSINDAVKLINKATK